MHGYLQRGLIRFANETVNFLEFSAGNMKIREGVCDAADHESMYQSESLFFLESFVTGGYSPNETDSLVHMRSNLRDKLSVCPVALYEETEYFDAVHRWDGVGANFNFYVWGGLQPSLRG